MNTDRPLPASSPPRFHRAERRNVPGIVRSAAAASCGAGTARPAARPRPTSAAAVLPTCCVTLALLAAGCRPYPAVTSPESLRLLRQVYTACNTHNDARLTACRTRLAELERAALVTAAEQRAFHEIIDRADRGEWDAAQRAALRFARDQLR